MAMQTETCLLQPCTPHPAPPTRHQPSGQRCRCPCQRAAARQGGPSARPTIFPRTGTEGPRTHACPRLQALPAPCAQSSAQAVKPCSVKAPICPQADRDVLEQRFIDNVAVASRIPSAVRHRSRSPSGKRGSEFRFRVPEHDPGSRSDDKSMNAAREFRFVEYFANVR